MRRRLLEAREIGKHAAAEVTAIFPTEHEEQVIVIDWWQYACKRYKLPEFALFAIPNAGAGAQSGQAGKMKAEGARPGIPDLCLALPRGEFHGLYIEMKRRHGSRVSVEQREVMGYLTRAGYLCALCHGANAAIQAIENYAQAPK
jgi:hypothetical protein